MKNADTFINFVDPPEICGVVQGSADVMALALAGD